MKWFRLGPPRWYILLASSPQLPVAYISNGPPAAPVSPKTLGLLGAGPSTLSFDSDIQVLPNQPSPHHPLRALVRHQVTREGRDLTKVTQSVRGRGLSSPAPSLSFPHSASFVLESLPCPILEYSGPAPEATLRVCGVKACPRTKILAWSPFQTTTQSPVLVLKCSRAADISPFPIPAPSLSPAPP